MRTVLLAWCALVVSAAPAFAFKGRVVDAQGRPVANATVSVLGRTGETVTDGEGRFEWRPDPPPPFEILVIDAGGTYFRPVLIERLNAESELLVTLTSLVSEPNVSIHEAKAFACQVAAGRDPGLRPTVPPAPWPTGDPL